MKLTFASRVPSSSVGLASRFKNGRVPLQPAFLITASFPFPVYATACMRCAVRYGTLFQVDDHIGVSAIKTPSAPRRAAGWSGWGDCFCRCARIAHAIADQGFAQSTKAECDLRLGLNVYEAIQTMLLIRNGGKASWTTLLYSEEILDDLWV